jgi:hypothetical protein
MTEQALQARMHFERRIDEAAKKAAAVVLREADPVLARHLLRELLRKVARDAAAQPEIFA